MSPLETASAYRMAMEADGAAFFDCFEAGAAAAVEYVAQRAIPATRTIEHMRIREVRLIMTNRLLQQGQMKTLLYHADFPIRKRPGEPIRLAMAPAGGEWRTS